MFSSKTPLTFNVPFYQIQATLKMSFHLQLSYLKAFLLEISQNRPSPFFNTLWCNSKMFLKKNVESSFQWLRSMWMQWYQHLTMFSACRIWFLTNLFLLLLWTSFFILFLFFFDNVKVSIVDVFFPHTYLLIYWFGIW